MNKNRYQVGSVIHTMLPGITREQMIEVDRIMIEDLKIPVELMMENAGSCLAHYIARFNSKRKHTIQVIVGSGNNGGGGLVAARRLSSWNRPVEVYLPRGIDSLRDVPKKQLERLQEMSITVHEGLPESPSKDIIVIDAYLGYNYKRRDDDITNRVFEFFSNRENIYSLDVPSGLDANTGEGVEGFQPEMTLTIAFPKIGFFHAHRKQTGAIIVCDIGIPSRIFESNLSIEWVEPYRSADLVDMGVLFERSRMVQVKRETHKKTGKVGWSLVM